MRLSPRKINIGWKCGLVVAYISPRFYSQYYKEKNLKVTLKLLDNLHFKMYIGGHGQVICKYYIISYKELVMDSWQGYGYVLEPNPHKYCRVTVLSFQYISNIYS